MRTEATRPGEFLLSEGPGAISRDRGTIAANLALDAGTVLGKRTKGTSATVTADSGNTGDGTVGSISLGNKSLFGDYVVTFIEPAADSGQFSVEDPNGKNIGTGTVGSQFQKEGMTFTISDGATDFVAGDRFVISVNEGTGEFAEYDPSAADGTERAAALLYEPVDTSDGAAADALVIARMAEADGDQLTGLDAAAEGQLAEQFLIVR